MTANSYDIFKKTTSNYGEYGLDLERYQAYRESFNTNYGFMMLPVSGFLKIKSNIN